MKPFDQFIVLINEFLGQMTHGLSSGSSALALGLGMF